MHMKEGLGFSKSLISLCWSTSSSNHLIFFFFFFAKSTLNLVTVILGTTISTCFLHLVSWRSILCQVMGLRKGDMQPLFTIISQSILHLSPKWKSPVIVQWKGPSNSITALMHQAADQLSRTWLVHHSLILNEKLLHWSLRFQWTHQHG